MSALHIGFDHNFIEHSRRVFEEYYPNTNTFVILKKTGALRIIKHPENFVILNLYDERNFGKLWKLCVDNDIDKIVFHGCSIKFASILKFLQTKRKFTVYWLFWGYELYQTLGYEKNYKLLDEPFSPLKISSYYVPNACSKLIRKLCRRYLPSVVMEMLPHIDYFCFWFKDDYDLLKKYFNVPIKYKLFAYSASKRGEAPPYLFDLKDRQTATIMVNHQASAFGNHKTVFRRLKELNCTKQYDVIVPLSYGSSWVKRGVVKMGDKLFGNSFSPITTYLPKEEYFRLLEKVDVAIFGQRRQEASGNIIQLLRNGVKVFLRNDNMLLNYYRARGYIIFSFEDDLIDEYSLRSLSILEKEHNRQCYMDTRLYYDDFMPTFFD